MKFYIKQFDKTREYYYFPSGKKCYLKDNTHGETLEDLYPMLFDVESWILTNESGITIYQTGILSEIWNETGFETLNRNLKGDDLFNEATVLYNKNHEPSKEIYIAPEERVAAALEYQNMQSMDASVPTISLANNEKSHQFKIVKSNYDKCLWGESHLNLAVKKGIITNNEKELIINNLKK